MLFRIIYFQEIRDFVTYGTTGTSHNQSSYYESQVEAGGIRIDRHPNPVHLVYCSCYGHQCWPMAAIRGSLKLVLY